MSGRAQAHTEAVTEANVHRFVRNLGGPEEQASPIQAAEERVPLHLVLYVFAYIDTSTHTRTLIYVSEEGMRLHRVRAGAILAAAQPVFWIFDEQAVYQARLVALRVQRDENAYIRT